MPSFVRDNVIGRKGAQFGWKVQPPLPREVIEQMDVVSRAARLQKNRRWVQRGYDSSFHRCCGPVRTRTHWLCCRQVCGASRWVARPQWRATCRAGPANLRQGPSGDPRCAARKALAPHGSLGLVKLRLRCTEQAMVTALVVPAAASDAVWRQLQLQRRPRTTRSPSRCSLGCRWTCLT